MSIICLLLFVGEVNDTLFLPFTFGSPPTPDPQNLSVRLKLRPTSAVGVLFALVYEDRIPLSVALADYNPDTDEWRDVSDVKITRVQKIPPAPSRDLPFFFIISALVPVVSLF